VTVLRPLFLIVLGIALVLSFFRYEESINEKNTLLTTPEQEQPEFFLDQSLTTRYLPDGSIDYQFNSEHLDYYKNANLAQSKMAYFIFFSSDGHNWHTRADNAIFSNDNKKIQLNGNVKIWQPTRNLELTTDELFVSEKKDYAETDKPVTIKSAAGITHSTGMTVDLNAEKLQLLSNVTGTYHVKP